MGKEKLSQQPSIGQIQIFKPRGPWTTKSGGVLQVAFALDFATVFNRYFAYDKDELDKIPCDIRGLRMYTISGLPKGKIGGKEFHRIREEMAFCIMGSFTWICKDLAGNTLEITLTPGMGVWMPPFILHEYKVLEENSNLVVLANTLFDPDKDATKDTYSSKEFQSLQEKHK